MKTCISISFLMLLLVTSYSFAQTTIPDNNFENYLETHKPDGTLVAIGDAESMGDGVDNNNEVLTDRITNVISLNITDLSIEDLTGIEDFVNLETLVCSNNRLTSINISANTSLKLLDISSNRIINEIDVSNNSNLESLFCRSNQISILNLVNNTLLKNLNVSDNQLTNLDLSVINTVVCPDPQTDPVTPCQNLSIIDVSNNQLIALNLANGYNNLITTFTSVNNPDLFCIQTDTGFTETNTWSKDDWTYFADVGCLDIYTYIPDDNFEQALIDLGYDDVLDNLVLTSNINSITTTPLDVSNLNIESLVGIEGFALLETLNCSGNNIEELDISINTALINLNCSGNNLMALNVNNNMGLTILDVSYNDIESIDLSSNTSLINLNCSNNNIKVLNLSNHSDLIDLNCESNALELLNIKNGQNGNLLNFSALFNPDLSCVETDTGAVPGGVTWSIDVTASYAVICGIYVPDDGLEQAIIDAGFDVGPLDNYVPTANVIGETDLIANGYGIVDLTGIESFPALSTFDCSDNNIVELDLTANTALTSVICSNNNLEFVDLRNGMNNPQLLTFDATNNPSLFCINVDDVTYSENAAGWQEDAIVNYNVDCLNTRYTDIFDDNFEQALVDLGIDTVPNDDRVLTANIEYVTSLNVNGKNIESLDGIKAFSSLIELDCSNNYLNALDVSNMANLEVFYCSSNYFVTNNPVNPTDLLNITGTPNLRILHCLGNLLEDLDVSANLNLEELNCSDNKITTLDISNNTLLVDLNCSANNINTLSTIGVDNSTLINFNCSNNQLNTLNVDRYLVLEDLNCSSNGLTGINTTNNALLENLNCSNNTISGLNIDSNGSLVILDASQNDLTGLNLTANNVALEYLDVNYNTITTIDLNPVTNLNYLYISNNDLSNLNVSNNPDLIVIDAGFNSLTGLVLSNNLNQLKTFNVNNNLLENDLDLSSLGTGPCPSGDDLCPDSITINVSNNLLDFVNIKNGINNDITNFNASINPNLYCIQVDDANNIDANWVKDATTDYNTDCRFGETYVPDDGFENRLIALGYDSVLDDYVTTINIEGLTDLDISGRSISDLTGIEDFIALQNLNCSNNLLTTIDLSDNIDLAVLNCSGNTLNTIDLTENINLTNLDISNNVFTVFDAILIPTLQILNCDSNQLTDLNLSLNPPLTSLSCASNLLEVLNIQNGQNPSLTNLNAQSNIDLTCILTDTGAEPAGVTWLKDATTEYAIDCHYGETYVPDDGFENKLISLGYDDVLDDYVLTANIQNLSYLDISESEILDLIGIEDFVSLTTLFFDENMIVDADLSANILLQNVNASNNDIATIDLSFLPNLRILNLSYNNLSTIDVDLNLNLVELYLISNMLTSLDVDLLTGLQKLNCTSNALQELDVTQNPNLIELFCQSNALIEDKLNLQNGANSTLEKFNATNNPNLGCILVDDPVEVISNTGGVYSAWFKDSTANYQTICDDADNDGIANADDQCPGTLFGETVDLFGCPILNLPNNNYTILVTDETCLNVNNGKINILTLEYYNYQATLTREGFSKVYDFTTEIDILNLLAGTYQLCITIEEKPDYITCYDVVIKHPEGLSVVTGKSSDGKKVSFNLEGSPSYNIDFNGLSFKTNKSELTLSLENGKNSIKISTDLECQGVHEESIFVSDEMFVYPNPFRENVNIYLGSLEQDNVSVNIYTYLGQLIYSKKVSKSDSRNLNVDTTKLNSGIYTVLISSSNGLSTFKIVKK